ncbi:MAG: hypothetical protein JWQ30_321 [Sediminibacterium sp.]|nr:hypothetical protein [Sediminibacterium sp.]
MVILNKKMRKIIEDVLKFPLEEKRDLYYALQQDLNEDTILREDELTPEQWQEVNKRNNDVESGKAQFISKEQLVDYLNERRNANTN